MGEREDETLQGAEQQSGNGDAALRLIPTETQAGSLDGPGLSTLHGALRAAATPCADICRAMVTRLGGDPDETLSRALVAIGEAADGSGLGNAYHNPAHSREVGFNWFCLALMNNRMASQGAATLALDRRLVLAGCCAAFGHDLRHDGRGNTVAEGAPGSPAAYRPFRLEALAADLAAELMGTAGADEVSIRTVRCAILLTDVRAGYPVLEASLGAGFDGLEAAAVRPEFSALEDPYVRLACAMLRDADLLPSAGMTLRDYDQRTAEMEAELGLSNGGMSPVAAEAFFGQVMGGRFLSPAASRFQQDLDRLRELNRRRAHEGASGL